MNGVSETRKILPGNGDNSALRARLAGRAPAASSVVAELQLAVLEREKTAGPAAARATSRR